MKVDENPPFWGLGERRERKGRGKRSGKTRKETREEKRELG